MKGQLGIDVIVSMIIFIIFASYLFFQLLAIRPRYLQEIAAERLRAETYQISEMLINDPGEPIDWDHTHVDRVGLADHTYNLTNLISWYKANELKLLCSDYDKLKEKIGVTEYQLLITIRNLTSWSGNKLFATCFPPEAIIRIGLMNFTIKRAVGIVAPNGERVAGELIVTMW